MSDQSVPEPLRKRYVSSFADKRVALEASLESLDAGSANEPAGLRGLAHKISGSAGMYGFDDLGQGARDVVHAIDGRSELALIRQLAHKLITQLADPG